MAVAAAATAALERFVRTAHDAGVGRDHLENLLRAGYVPQPKQLHFHAAARRCDAPDGPTAIGFGGARGPGKSHATFGQVGADDCQRVPGLKWLHLRKVGKAAREGLEDLLPRVLGGIPYEYSPSRSMVRFPNGSRIIIGNFATERDIDKYLGLEYDGATIEEATQLPAQHIKNIESCVRTSKPNWRPRIYFTTNPGGVGHQWFRRRFITAPDQWTEFIPATVDDNRFVNPEYRRTLDSYTGWQLRAWRYGDWDIAAGQYFTTFRRDIHVKPDIVVQPHWQVWAALDYGFTHYTACYLFAKDGDGHVYIVDEHAAQRWLAERHAAEIGRMFERHGVARWDADANKLGDSRLRSFVAGGDVFQKRSEGLTVAGQYANFGITLSQANDDRINGAAEFLRRMGDVEASIAPSITISDRCVRLADCLASLQHDPNRPEDVLKVDTDSDGNGGDDYYDAARYGVMAEFNPAQSILDHYAQRFAARLQETPQA